jgi:diphosphomevalonate decarboxylase
MKFAATAEASPNIAFVKYWGLRDERLNLPCNGSISVTMSDNLKTRTSVTFSPNFKNDSAWLNGKKVAGSEFDEIVKQLDIIREKAGVRLKTMVEADTNFPIGAGLASSASGFASLTCASAKALNLNLDERELSLLARRVSGSACRSIYGGFVEWKKGVREDGEDSYSIQLVSKEHWSEFRNVIAITNSGKKKVSSRDGMRRTVATSRLYKKRIKELPKTLAVVREAILRKDYKTLFEVTMYESDNFHVVLLDSYPPLVYLNETSRKIVEAVREFNSNETKAAYTFDAGPNAHVFTLERYTQEVERFLSEIKGVKKIIVCKPGNGVRYL